MYHSTQTSTGPSAKQTKTWEKAIKKFEHNEELREKYQPFESSSNDTITHLHRLTTTTTIDELITKARETNTYTIDTESQMVNRKPRGALVQIQFLASKNESTIILFETFHLPNFDSIQFLRMKELCSIIFNKNNTILSWGTLEKELENFQEYKLFESGKKCKRKNLQLLFSDWHNQHPIVAHPKRERREERTWGVQNNLYETPGDDNDNPSKCTCGHHTHYNPGLTWSLQDAIATTLHRFLDKNETLNKWSCGLDLSLNTWKFKLFSKEKYDPNVEQQKRIIMKKYATNDVIAFSQLYSIIYPEQTNEASDVSDDEVFGSIQPTFNKLVEPKSPQPNKTFDLDHSGLIELIRPKFNKPQQKPTPQDETSDVSDTELLESLRPKFNKPRQTPPPVAEQDLELLTSTTQEEMNSLNPPDKEPDEGEQIPQQRAQLSKSERQRMKNEKLKWKRKNRADFQNFIRRPIYRQYDYLKIRSQLEDDDIHTSHQIKISEDRLEVKIRFKSNAQLEHARRKMKINYFSREQYIKRWC